MMYILHIKHIKHFGMHRDKGTVLKISVQLGFLARFFGEKDFESDSEAVFLNDRGRRTVLTSWQKRKAETVQHPFLREKIPIGMIPYAQAMLFARVLRGDLDRYPPFVWR